MRHACIFLILFLFAACQISPPKERLVLVPSSYGLLMGWESFDHGNALSAYAKSCHLLLKSDRQLDGIRVHADDWTSSCREARRLIAHLYNQNDARQFFEAHFTPYHASTGIKNTGLFTGYHEIELKGSRKRSTRFAYPIYRAPKNSQRTRSRAEIENGALRGQKLELAYVDDPVQLFFLHIQGSGVVYLPDGTIMRVGYAGQNGHPYVALGSILAEEGIFERSQITAQTIKAWLYQHPGQAASSYMNRNPSYVFFRELPPDKPSPLGAAGVVLTPSHSLAVDTSYIPLGTPLWLETSIPDLYDLSGQPVAGSRPFTGLLVAQDKGGAIKGPVRCDIFFGRGVQAELEAGHMKQQGKAYLLLPKPELAASEVADAR